jgi:hypothetical protein
MTANDKIKLFHLEQFQKRFIELTRDYPDVKVYGDDEGCVHASVDLDEPDWLSGRGDEYIAWGSGEIAELRQGTTL